MADQTDAKEIEYFDLNQFRYYYKQSKLIPGFIQQDYSYMCPRCDTKLIDLAIRRKKCACNYEWRILVDTSGYPLCLWIEGVVDN